MWKRCGQLAFVWALCVAIVSSQRSYSEERDFPYPAPDGHLRLVTWNIEFLGSRSPPRSNDDLSKIAPRLLSFDAPVLALQEIFSYNTIVNIREELGPNWVLYRASENAILYNRDKVEALSLSTMRSLSSPPFSPYPHVAEPVMGVFRPVGFDREPFRVIGVHWKANDPLTRAKEKAWLEQRVKELLSGPDPIEEIFVMGDFNDDPQFDEIPLFKLPRARQAEGPVGRDHIYVTPAAFETIPDPMSQTILPAHYGESTGVFARIYSDHLPVFVDIRAVDEPPQAAFTVTPAVGEPPLDVVVDAAGSSTTTGHEIVRYDWDFGGGALAQGQGATHRYEQTGRYAICLVVEDDRGASAAVTVSALARETSGDVSPWTVAPVGAPGEEGAARVEEADVVIQGTRGEINGRTDSFYYAFQRRRGAFTLTSQVVDWRDVTSSLAKLGLMVRESLAVDARHATVALETRQGTAAVRYLRRFYQRSETGGTTAIATNERFGSPALWLRLERLGDSISGSVSVDGESWSGVETAVLEGLPDEVYVGVVATGQPENGVWSVARLGQLGFSSEEFVRGDCNADGAPDVSDAIFHLSFLFDAGLRAVCAEACDINDDAELDVSDGILLLSHLFGRGPAPTPPYPECGPDPDPSVGQGCDERTCP